MKSKQGKISGRGFTLVELLVTIAILAVLATVVLSTAKRAGIQSKLTASISQVRGLGPLVHAYAQDNGGILPVWKDGDTYWWQKIAGSDSFDAEGLFKSPNHREFDRDRVDATISYGWNASVMGRTTGEEGAEDVGTKRMVNFSQPADVLVLADGAKQDGFGLIDPSGPLPDPERYNDKVAALMLDGSARIMNARVDFKADSKWFIAGDL